MNTISKSDEILSSLKNSIKPHTTKTSSSAQSGVTIWINATASEAEKIVWWAYVIDAHGKQYANIGFTADRTGNTYVANFEATISALEKTDSLNLHKGSVTVLVDTPELARKLIGRGVRISRTPLHRPFITLERMKLRFSDLGFLPKALTVKNKAAVLLEFSVEKDGNIKKLKGTLQ